LPLLIDSIRTPGADILAFRRDFCEPLKLRVRQHVRHCKQGFDDTSFVVSKAYLWHQVGVKRHFWLHAMCACTE